MSKQDFSPKDQLIVAQVAVKGAIDMIVAGKTDQRFADTARYIESIVWEIASGSVSGHAEIPRESMTFDDLEAEAEAAVRDAFPGAQVIQHPSSVNAAPQSQGVSPMPPHSADTRDKGEKAANKNWGQARYEVAPDEFWDNRDKKAAGDYKPTAPDLKHKESGLAVWLS
jgi:hypothetical protein